MSTQNSQNTSVTINDDGFDIAGGVTPRKLTLSGGDATIVGSGATNIITLPSTTSTVAIGGYATTVTAVGTTTLIVSSHCQQFFTGITTQIVVMPVVSTLTLGRNWQIINNSTDLITVNSSGGNAIVIVAGGTSAILTCILLSGTDAASWSVSYQGISIVTGKKLTVNKIITFDSADDTSVITLPTGSKTLVATDGTTAKTTNLVGGNNTTLLGSIPYQSNVDETTLLPPNTAAVKNFFNQTGTGGNGAVPSWNVIDAIDVPTLNQNTSGNAGTATKLAATKNINGVAFDGSADIILPSITWSIVTADGNLAINTGTLANKASLCVLTLPVTAAIGTVIKVAGMNQNLFKIAQNANQIIHFGSTNTTTGAGGYIQSTLTYDSVELVCVVANLEFMITGSIGNITIV